MKKSDNLYELPNLPGNKCFGCGEMNRNGLNMRFFTDGRFLYSDVPAGAWMNGWNGVVHGGIVSTILDEVMGWGAIFFSAKFILTKNMTVNYHKPLLVKDMIHAESYVKMKTGDREITMGAGLYNSDNELCASAIAVFGIFNMEFVKKKGFLSDSDIENLQKILNTVQNEFKSEHRQ